MKKLQTEIDDVMPDSQTIPDITVLQRLPYLNAFIKEGWLDPSLGHSHNLKSHFTGRFEALWRGSESSRASCTFIEKWTDK
jgi:hypothetical protein